MDMLLLTENYHLGIEYLDNTNAESTIKISLMLIISGADC